MLHHDVVKIIIIILLLYWDCMIFSNGNRRFNVNRKIKRRSVIGRLCMDMQVDSKVVYFTIYDMDDLR